WLARIGLSEEALLSIARISPIDLALLRTSLSRGLIVLQTGLTVRNGLGSAIALRYLGDRSGDQKYRRELADYYFSADPETKARELPHQLIALEDWERLQDVLTDLNLFSALRRQGNGALERNWIPLTKRGASPEALLCEAFRVGRADPKRWSIADFE